MRMKLLVVARDDDEIGYRRIGVGVGTNDDGFGTMTTTFH